MKKEELQKIEYRNTITSKYVKEVLANLMKFISDYGLGFRVELVPDPNYGTGIYNDELDAGILDEVLPRQAHPIEKKRE